jgi:hypothetical protein
MVAATSYSAKLWTGETLRDDWRRSPSPFQSDGPDLFNLTATVILVANSRRVPACPNSSGEQRRISGFVTTEAEFATNINLDDKTAETSRT